MVVALDVDVDVDVDVLVGSALVATHRHAPLTSAQTCPGTGHGPRHSGADAVKQLRKFPSVVLVGDCTVVVGTDAAATQVASPSRRHRLMTAFLQLLANCAWVPKSPQVRTQALI